MLKPALAIALGLLAGCTTLPGYQGGPGPRSTQYTYPGRSFNPDSGLAHSPVPTVAEPEEGGIFVYGLVFADGSSGEAVDRFPTRAACEQDRAAYGTLVKEIGGTVRTVRCYRAHETGVMQTR